MSVDDAAFSEFVRANSRALVRVAWLMTGDSAAAEDLAQAALAHTWVRWRRIRSPEAAGIYVRKVMLTTYRGWRRRRWTGEVACDVLPEIAVPDAIDQTLL